MARLAKSDPLQGFRFHVKVVDGFDGLNYVDPDHGEAGFQAVSTPELTVETIEYREGTSVYTFKFPGVPSVSTLTLSRGVYLMDTSFHDWVRMAVEGGEYRADLVIYHWHRVGKVPGLPEHKVMAKRYKVWNATPSRVKPAADLDSTSGEVSLSEVDIDYENFMIELPTEVA